jgi:hypothetical protein
MENVINRFIVCSLNFKVGACAAVTDLVRQKDAVLAALPWKIGIIEIISTFN